MSVLWVHLEVDSTKCPCSLMHTCLEWPQKTILMMSHIQQSLLPHLPLSLTPCVKYSQPTSTGSKWLDPRCCRSPCPLASNQDELHSVARDEKVWATSSHIVFMFLFIHAHCTRQRQSNPLRFYLLANLLQPQKDPYCLLCFLNEQAYTTLVVSCIRANNICSVIIIIIIACLDIVPAVFNNPLS